MNVFEKQNEYVKYLYIHTYTYTYIYIYIYVYAISSSGKNAVQMLLQASLRCHEATRHAFGTASP